MSNSDVERTLWTKGDADGIGKDVDTLENAGSALVRELDLLVGTTS
jgi:hypothetical protein